MLGYLPCLVILLFLLLLHVGPTSTTTSTFNKSSPQTEDSQALPNKGWRKVEEGEGEGKGKGKGERVGQVSSCQCYCLPCFGLTFFTFIVGGLPTQLKDTFVSVILVCVLTQQIF